MKWAQTTAVLKSDGVKKKDKNLFKEYETEQELEKDLCDGEKFVKWVTYPDDDPLETPFDLDRKAQRKYEVLCGGFLYYHDVVFKKYPEGAGYEYPNEYPNKDGKPAIWKVYPETFIGPDGKEHPGKDFEHNIYFEWFPKDKKTNNKTRVIIHINPTPPKFNSSPPPPPKPPPPES